LTPRLIDTIFEVQDLIAPTRGRSDNPADDVASPLEAPERRIWSVGGLGR
jgi:hypothetical protein